MTAPSPSAPLTAAQDPAWEREQPLEHEYHAGESGSVRSTNSAELGVDAVHAAMVALGAG